MSLSSIMQANASICLCTLPAPQSNKRTGFNVPFRDRSGNVERSSTGTALMIWSVKLDHGSPLEQSEHSLAACTCPAASALEGAEILTPSYSKVASMKEQAPMDSCGNYIRSLHPNRGGLEAC